MNPVACFYSGRMLVTCLSRAHISIVMEGGSTRTVVDDLGKGEAANPAI